MRRAVATVAVALITLSLSAATAAEQEKTARGKVTALSGASITLDVKGQPMTFVVDNMTNVIARGAGTKTREMEKTTGAKPKLTDVIKVGENAEVSYTEAGGTMTAKAIRAVATAPTGTSGPATQHLEGVVSDVSANSLTVKPTSGDAVTFMVDPKVRVTGQGLGTMSREKQTLGANVTLVDAVKAGDTVDVTYMAMDTMKHASAVRVVKKKM